MAKEIILCFDGDAAGLKATNACVRELAKLNVKPKVVRLEDNLDPDEYIKKYGKEEFIKKLENAKSSVEFKINSLKDIYDLKDIQEKAIYAKEAINLLNEYDDEIMREIAINELIKDTELTEDFIKGKLKKIVNKDEYIDTLIKIEPQKIQKGLNKYDKAQINLIYYMLMDKRAIAIYKKRVNHMPKKEYRILAKEIVSYFEKYKEISVSLFVNHVARNEIMKKTLDFVLEQNLRDTLDITEIMDYTNVINEYNINEKINNLNKQLQTVNNHELEKEILNEIKDLINLKLTY